LRRRQAARAVVAEALVLSVLGLILALALGCTLGALWVRTTFPALLGWTLSLRIPVGQTAVLGFAAIAVCLLSSLLPALSAVRLDPATAVRLE
jgi:ABC-type antimicrobial peptide transport system permease subunit